MGVKDKLGREIYEQYKVQFDFGIIIASFDTKLPEGVSWVDGIIVSTKIDLD